MRSAFSLRLYGPCGPCGLKRLESLVVRKGLMALLGRKTCKSPFASYGQKPFRAIRPKGQEHLYPLKKGYRLRRPHTIKRKIQRGS